MTGRRLVLVRHGRTSWNESGRAQGHADVGLDSVGHRQAAAAAPYVASLRPGGLWSSDLLRARQTCSYFERETGLSAKYDERLRELDVGEREGTTLPEVAGAPGAEKPSEVEERMLPVLREALTSLAAGETGVVVTHGTATRVGLVALLGWPVDLAVGLRGLDNCGCATVEELEPGGRLRLVGYNESLRGASARCVADFASGAPVG